VVVEPIVDSPITMATMPIVSSLIEEINEEEEHVFQGPIVNHEQK
jgi:hypothetical protein